jgi:hypothetical protein
MLVIGIAGVAGAFEGPDDSRDSGSSSATDFSLCDTSDERFSEFTTIEVTGEGGTATVAITCEAGTRTATMLGSGVTTDEARTVALWLYRSRKDALLIGSAQQEAGDDTVALRGDLPAITSDYPKLVVSAGPPGEDSPRLTDVIMQGTP